MTSKVIAVFTIGVALFLGATFKNENAATPLLKEVFARSFTIGAAVNDDVVSGNDAQAADLVAMQFNSITPENVMKWEHIHPTLDKYDFGPSDRFVEFGEKRNMFIVGHTLLWHQQTPRWMFTDAAGKTVGRETLLQRLRDHIHTVVGRYKGRVHGWDVVNEALEDDGSLRQSQWMKIIGEDYIAKAFELAHEADPKAELYYNDYSLENEPKRNGALALIKQLRKKNIRVTGVGTQGHYKMDWPSPARLDSTINAFNGLGIRVMITELDIDLLPDAMAHQGADISLRAKLRDELNPYGNGLPDSMQQKLARRYAELFGVFLRNSKSISRVTFWGAYDKTSWLNNWPVPGRTSYPLLFDRKYQPKPAFYEVVKTTERK